MSEKQDQPVYGASTTDEVQPKKRIKVRTHHLQAWTDAPTKEGPPEKAGLLSCRNYAECLTFRRWLVSHRGYDLLRLQAQIATMKRSDSTVLPSGISIHTGPSTMIGPLGTILTRRGSASLTACLPLSRRVPPCGVLPGAGPWPPARERRR